MMPTFTTEIPFLLDTQTSATASRFMSQKNLWERALLVPRIVSAHAGIFYNNTVFTPEGMRRNMKTWPGCPVLPHGHYSDHSAGAVIQGKYRDTSGGRTDYVEESAWSSKAAPALGEEVVWVSLTDADFAQKLLSGAYGRVSASRMPDMDMKNFGVCSICGSLTDTNYMAGRVVCAGRAENEDGEVGPYHIYGRKYPVKQPNGKTVEKKAFVVMSGWTNVHLAFTPQGNPADVNTGIEEFEKIHESLKPTASLYAVTNDGHHIYDLWSDHCGDDLIKDIEDEDREVLTQVLETQTPLVKKVITPVTRDLHDTNNRTIYPTGIKNTLDDTQFNKVKEILGSKHITTSRRDRLPDNAFAGPSRTFPAHNIEHIKAGLFLLDEFWDSWDQNDLSTRDAVYLELRRREAIHGSDRPSSEFGLNDEQFARAHAIHSLVTSGCCSEASGLEDDADYRALMDAIREDRIPAPKLVELYTSNGIGPKGCLPVHTPAHKVASLALLSDEGYSGPVPAAKLREQLTPESTGNTKSPDTPTKGSRNMEKPTLNDVLQFLGSDSANDQAISIILADPRIAKRVSDERNAAVQKAITDTQEAQQKKFDDQTKALTDRYAAYEKEFKTAYAEAIVDAQINLGLLDDAVDEKLRREKITALQDQSLLELSTEARTLKSVLSKKSKPAPEAPAAELKSTKAEERTTKRPLFSFQQPK